MKSNRVVVSLTILVFTFSAAISASGTFTLCNATQLNVSIAPTVEPINFGPLINAPNGHISFQRNAQGFRIWVPGRRNLSLKVQPDPSHEEGGFLFDISDWSSDVLAAAKPTFTLGHLVDDDEPNCGSYIFDRNYEALNAVVPGAEPGTLLGFYDAEYHVDCPNGEPLLSSIGIATSTDGGVTWQNQSQIIQGLDEATFKAAGIVKRQFAALPNIVDSGASGPSVVEREADGADYLYLYYADRTPITGGPDSIYVARALLTTDGAQDSWQKWDGTSWGKIGRQKPATPILVPTGGARLALQPHVSWNTSLNEWLMVFKTAIDFEVATSVDGLHWDPPVSLLRFDPKFKNGFPTLISVDEGETSQQVTGATAYLYWSSLAPDAKVYAGQRALVTISK